MPYIVLSANNEEIDRRELRNGKPVVIGRALEADMTVLDIMLSRQHCRVEQTPEGWTIVDLKSRNGTLLHGQPIDRHVLADKETLRIGRTKITFHAGTFEPAPTGGRRKDRPVRPADPNEALAGTVSGFEYIEPELLSKACDDFPLPKPRSVDEPQPATVTKQARSGARAAAPSRPLPRPVLNADLKRPDTHVDLSLQVVHPNQGQAAAAARPAAWTLVAVALITAVVVAAIMWYVVLPT